MIKELKYFLYAITIIGFIFFILNYYFSDENKKNSYRSTKVFDNKIVKHIKTLQILESDTENIVEYVENTFNIDKNGMPVWTSQGAPEMETVDGFIRSKNTLGTRLIKDKEREKIQASINDTYEKFKNRVIAGRDDMPEDANLDDVALGRVFTGQRAKDGISIPLVDVNGGLHDAI